MKRHILSTVFFKSFVIILCLLGFVGIHLTTAAAMTPISFSGVVEFRPAGEEGWRPLQENTVLQAGDLIRTGATGNVSFWLEDGSELHLGPNTEFLVEELQFSEAQNIRVFRFKLLRGSVRTNVQELDFAHFKITGETLANLKKEGVPGNIVDDLASLQDQEFASEEKFLEAIKKQIGGKDAVRYKLFFLEYADTQQEVFDIETTEVVIGANYSTAVTIIANPGIHQTDVLVYRNRFKMRRIAREGIVKISGLLNAQEGVTFLLNSSGDLARVKVEECDIHIESSAPVSDYQALIGDTDTMIGISNGEDSPPFNVLHEKDNTTELGGNDEAIFGIPSDQGLLLEASDVVNTSFGFCKQFSSFVFVRRGCPEINGEENCCGEISFEDVLPDDAWEDDRQDAPEGRGETLVVPPAPLNPEPGGGSGYVPPDPIPPQPGSPSVPGGKK